VYNLQLDPGVVICPRIFLWPEKWPFMLTRLLIGLLLIESLLWVAQNRPIEAQTPRQEFSQTVIIEAKPVDPRVEILEAYLREKKSPLVAHSKDFIEAADQYHLDWKLVPAITGVESSFGIHTPGNYANPSYNGWGWGVYGTQALGFRSWKDGIYTVSQGLKEKYVDKGLTDPYTMNRIYASSPTWGYKVQSLMDELEQFGQKFPKYKSQNNQPVKLETSDAGTSAKLVAVK
jgi:hypothetical protein